MPNRLLLIILPSHFYLHEKRFVKIVNFSRTFRSVSCWWGYHNCRHTSELILSNSEKECTFCTNRRCENQLITISQSKVVLAAADSLLFLEHFPHIFCDIFLLILQSRRRAGGGVAKTIFATPSPHPPSFYSPI